MPTISSNTVGVNIQVKRQIVRLDLKKRASSTFYLQGNAWLQRRKWVKHLFWNGWRAVRSLSEMTTEPSLEGWARGFPCELGEEDVFPAAGRACDSKSNGRWIREGVAEAMKEVSLNYQTPCVCLDICWWKWAQWAPFNSYMLPK